MIAGILVAIFAPMAASLVQMAISRSREYEADRIGAEIAGDPAALASALARIDQAARRNLNPAAERNPATAYMFIINPLNGRNADNLFSTHPNTANRIAKLRAMGDAGEAHADDPSVGPWGAAPSASDERPRGPWG